MGWALLGAAILAVLAIGFHLFQEYFWSVVFIFAAALLVGWALVLASNQGLLGALAGSW